jgi:hypothetical protein
LGREKVLNPTPLFGEEQPDDKTDVHVEIDEDLLICLLRVRADLGRSAPRELVETCGKSWLDDTPTRHMMHG